MPNISENTLELRGSQATLNAIFKKLTTQTEISKESGSVWLEIDQLFPCKDTNEAWVEKFGTKYTLDLITTREPEFDTYIFSSSWVMPTKFYKLLNAKFPNISIKATAYEPMNELQEEYNN